LHHRGSTMGLDANHDRLEADVKDFLTNEGFLTASATYHDVYDEPMVEILQTRYSPTALYIRGRADRVAVHSGLPIEFEYECKTNSGKHRNMAVEALPWLHHLSKVSLGVRCLYVYRDTVASMDRGVWIGHSDKCGLKSWQGLQQRGWC
jgi:hypothetical protein